MCCVVADDMFGCVIKLVERSDIMQNKDPLVEEYHLTRTGTWESKTGWLKQDHLVVDLMTKPDLQHTNIGSYALTLQCQHRYVGIVWGADICGAGNDSPRRELCGSK